MAGLAGSIGIAESFDRINAYNSIKSEVERRLESCVLVGKLASIAMIERQKGTPQKTLMSKIKAMQLPYDGYELSLTLINGAYMQPMAPTKDIAEQVIRRYAYGHASTCVSVLVRLNP